MITVAAFSAGFQSHINALFGFVSIALRTTISEISGVCRAVVDTFFFRSAGI